MNFNTSHESIDKYFTKIIRVMRKIEFTKSPESTTITQ